MYKHKINISKDQWKKLIQDKDIFKNEDIELIKMIFACNNYKATGKQLALLLNIKNHGTINLQVWRLGERIINKLNIPINKRDDGSKRWWHILFWGEETKEGFYWILRPELRKAIKELNQEKKIELIEKEINIPEEISFDEDIQLFEGAKKQIYVNYYERNNIARKSCINHYGAKCIICGFDFEKKYGEIGKNVIHVHHIKPLSEVGQNYEVDPIKDLRPVCPNCHLIIHKKNPPYTIKEVKEMIDKTKSKWCNI